MAYKTIQAPLDNGNHALTGHCGVLFCVFCLSTCATQDAGSLMTARCHSRRKKAELISKEAFESILSVLAETLELRNGDVRNVSVKYLVNDADSSDRCLEIAGSRFCEK